MKMKSNMTLLHYSTSIIICVLIIFKHLIFSEFLFCIRKNLYKLNTMGEKEKKKKFTNMFYLKRKGKY